MVCLRAKTSIRNIIQGLLKSEKIVRYIAIIPCDIIHKLENDVWEAETFTDQFKNGEVPTLIEDLPQEVVGAFKDMVGIFLTLLSQIVSAAEVGITDAAKIFNDIESGAIVSDIENLPGVIVSDVTSVWGDFTSGLEDDWNAATHAFACFIGDCPVTSDAVGSCRGNTEQATSATHIRPQSSSKRPSPTDPTLPLNTGSTITTISPAGPVAELPSPSQTGSQSNSRFPFSTGLTLPSNTGSSTASQGSYSSRAIQLLAQPSIFQFCWLTELGLVGIALVL